MTTPALPLLRPPAPAEAAPPAGDSPVPVPESLRGLAAELGAEFAEDLADRAPSPEFLEKVPIAFARQHGMLGLAGDAASLPVAIGAAESWDQLEVVARFLGKSVRPVFAEPAVVASAIDAAYAARTGQAERFLRTLDAPAVRGDDTDPSAKRRLLEDLHRLAAEGAAGGGKEDLLDASGRAPVIRLVNLVLFEAVQQSASDIHFQPYEDRLVVRLRIDGVLFDAFELPKPLQEEVLSRVKVMGRMNIAEKRLAQDGRATVRVGERLIDLRIASLPTSCGERLVVRLLDKSARLYTLDDLGMGAATLETFRGLIGVEHGLILVTGPTGGGKSTTLYAALQELNAQELNILTLEDPIEYQLPGVSQTQVSSKKGMTFASGLRHVLRQDPDIIMVGEIRDHETAVMAIQSALTGHLVFSTLHTNDAASAVTRLLDLGIEPYLVASSLVGVLAQRLVRRVCRACGAPAGGTDAEALREWAKLGLRAENLAALDTAGVRKGTGCNACRGTGYRGRVGLFELMVIDDALRRKVQARAAAAEIKEAAVARGMRSLREEGVTKVLAGVTTPEEVFRVTMRATQ